MAWTESEVQDLLESSVNEYNASKYWASGELTLYLKAAMSTLLSKYTPWLYHEYGSWEDLGMVAGTTEYDKPSSCYRIYQILRKEDGAKLRFIPRDELFKYRDYDAGDVIGWTFKNNQVHVIPEPSATDADFAEIHYMPILDSVTEFPDSMRPLIAIEAATLALLKDKYESAALFQLKKAYEQNVYVELCMFTPPSVFPDFMEEDSLA